MLRLTDDELDIVRRFAEPLHPSDRGIYLKRVSALLDGHEVGPACFTAVASKLNLSCGNRPPSTGVAVRLPRTRNRRARAAAAVSADRAGRGGGYPTSNRTAVRHSASAAFPSGRCIWSKRRNANGTGEGRP